MIDTIVFDLGGVLIDLDMEVCKEHFISLLGYTKISELLDPCHQRGIYSDLEEGILSPDAFRAEVLKDSRPGGRGQVHVFFPYRNGSGQGGAAQ